jgi:hypothetical protein
MAADRRRWSFEEGGAARRPWAAVAGGPAGGGCGGGTDLECGGGLDFGGDGPSLLFFPLSGAAF